MEHASRSGFEEGSRRTSRALSTSEDSAQKEAQNSSDDEAKLVSATDTHITLDESRDDGSTKYAHGMRLVLIMASLLMTFLTVLLDTVRSNHFSPSGSSDWGLHSG
jgi:hypothetical protein